LYGSLFFHSLYQFQLVEAYIGREKPVIYHCLVLFYSFYASYRFSFEHTYPVADFPYRFRFVFFLPDSLFFLFFFLFADNLCFFLHFPGYLLLFYFFLFLFLRGLGLPFAVLGFHDLQEFGDQGAFFLIRKI